MSDRARAIIASKKLRRSIDRMVKVLRNDLPSVIETYDHHIAFGYQSEDLGSQQSKMSGHAPGDPLAVSELTNLEADLEKRAEALEDISARLFLWIVQREEEMRGDGS